MSSKQYNTAKKIDRLIIMLTSIAILACLFILSYFGNPYADESFPFAITLRFINGQRPFIDDFSPYITLGLLLTPIVKMSMLVHHGKNELLLFSRQLFAVLVITIGTYQFFITRKFLPQLLAFFLSIMLIIYHPFGINNFHYDTLATLFWTVILMQLGNFIINYEHNIVHYMLFAIFSLILCLSYPTFAFLVPPLYLVSLFWVKDKLKFISSLIVVFIISLSLLCWLLFYHFGISFSDIKTTLMFSHNVMVVFQGYENIFQKYVMVFERLVKQYGTYFVISTFLLAATRLFRKIKGLIILNLLILLAFPFSQINISHSAYSETFYVLNCYGLLGGLLFLFFLKKNTLCRQIFTFMYVPSILGALLTCSSYNLSLNLIIGFFPAYLISFIFIYVLIHDCYLKWEWLVKPILFYGVTVLTFFQMHYCYGINYFGMDIYKKSIKYNLHGPLYGLYFDPIPVKTVQRMQMDLSQIDTNGNAYIYCGNFTAAYLMIDHLKVGDYLAYCCFNNNHWGMPLRTPCYLFDSHRFLGVPDANEYLQGVNTKIIARELYDVYYASPAKRH